MFHLTVTNNGQLPVKMATKLDINFLGLKVSNVGVLIVDDPTQVLDKKHQTKLPGIVGWNLIWVSYNAFVEQYGASGFDSFVCPEGVNPLLFSQLCVFMQTQITAMNWECHLTLCPNKLDKYHPQKQMTCLKKKSTKF